MNLELSEEPPPPPQAVIKSERNMNLIFIKASINCCIVRKDLI